MLKAGGGGGGKSPEASGFFGLNRSNSSSTGGLNLGRLLDVGLLDA
jgi:hypothetical protein